MATSNQGQLIAAVSGTAQGIGWHIAQELAKKGYRLLLLNRTLPDNTLLRTWKKALGKDNFELIRLDLCSLESTRQAAREIQSKVSRLDLLINNAGGLYPGKDKHAKAKQIDQNLMVNYLAPFLLTQLLLKELSASPKGHILTLVSDLQFNADWREDGFDFTDRYKPLQAYSNAQLASVTFICKLSHLLSDSSVVVNCLYPGRVATNIRRQKMGWRSFLWPLLSRFMLTPAKAAEKVLDLVTDPALGSYNGRYMNENRQWCAPASLALSVDFQNRLWTKSKQAVGLAAG